MSRILVFGGDGLLGSHLYLALRHRHSLGLTLHREASAYPARLFSDANVFDKVAAEDAERIVAVIDTFRPDWIVNAVGLVKRPAAVDPVASLLANTVFPHLLERECATRGIRLVHFSTDCVYGGSKGMYTELDVPDNPDWHGRCKTLGEPAGAGVLVLRTSFVGLELGCKRSLIEWFLAQQGVIPGYRRAIWSGFPAIEVARIVGRLVESDDAPSGLWHLATPAISKFELLSRLNQRLGSRGVTVVANDGFVCNRSLDGSAFARRIGYVPPSWDNMLDELAEDIGQRWSAGVPSYWLATDMAALRQGPRTPDHPSGDKTPGDRADIEGKQAEATSDS